MEGKKRIVPTRVLYSISPKKKTDNEDDGDECKLDEWSEQEEIDSDDSIQDFVEDYHNYDLASQSFAGSYKNVGVHSDVADIVYECEKLGIDYETYIKQQLERDRQKIENLNRNFGDESFPPKIWSLCKCNKYSTIEGEKKSIYGKTFTQINLSNYEDHMEYHSEILFTTKVIKIFDEIVSKCPITCPILKTYVDTYLLEVDRTKMYIKCQSLTSDKLTYKQSKMQSDDIRESIRINNLIHKIPPPDMLEHIDEYHKVESRGGFIYVWNTVTS